MAGDCTFLTRLADIPEQPESRSDCLADRPPAGVPAERAPAGLPAGSVPTETHTNTIPANADRLRLLAGMTPSVGHDSTRGKTPGTGARQAGWPRHRITSARRGTAGAEGTSSRAPR